jgi:hypothetical protein
MVSLKLFSDHPCLGKGNVACTNCVSGSDRALPSCSTCLKSAQPCEYPSTAQKPGPKTGGRYLHQLSLHPQNVQFYELQISAFWT